MNSCLVDINVWLAVSHSEHVHHSVASLWLERLESTAYFCRPTQLGYLRLLTNPHVMGESVRTQRQAWEAYNALLSDVRIDFLQEVVGLESHFRALTQAASHSPNTWGDAYLGAFARASGLTIVSLDGVFRTMPGVDAIILRS